jgi:large subunit ribosomal protein L30
MAKKKAEKKIRITLVRSTIGRKPYQRQTVKALGLGKINSSVEQEASQTILGMVNAVSHLVKVEEMA